MTAALRWLVDVEGSTRSAALLRIGIVLVAWARYGRELLLHQNLADGRWLITVVFFVSSVPALLGFRARASVLLFGASVLAVYGYTTYLTGYFASAPLVGQHPYLMGVALCLLALTPCGRSLSVDRWIALKGGRALPEHGPLWGLRLIGVQISVMYLWAAFDKTTWIFLSGARLEHLVTYFYTYVRPSFPGAAVVFPIAACTVVAFEYALVVGLWLPKTRKAFILLGLAFHAIIYVTLSVQTFSALMFVLYLVFVPPGVVHRAMDTLLGASPGPGATWPDAGGGKSP